jgi:hypothetical protein
VRLSRQGQLPSYRPIRFSSFSANPMFVSVVNSAMTHRFLVSSVRGL